MTGVFRHSKYRIARRGKYVGQYIGLDEDEDQGEGADDVEMGEEGDYERTHEKTYPAHSLEQMRWHCKYCNMFCHSGRGLTKHLETHPSRSPRK